LMTSYKDDFKFCGCLDTDIRDSRLKIGTVSVVVQGGGTRLGGVKTIVKLLRKDGIIKYQLIFRL
jgi:hypothetical protein